MLGHWQQLQKSFQMKHFATTTTTTTIRQWIAGRTLKTICQSFNRKRKQAVTVRQAVNQLTFDRWMRFMVGGGNEAHNQSGSHFRTLIDNNRGRWGGEEDDGATAQKTGIEWNHRRRWCRWLSPCLSISQPANQLSQSQLLHPNSPQRRQPTFGSHLLWGIVLALFHGIFSLLFPANGRLNIVGLAGLTSGPTFPHSGRNNCDWFSGFVVLRSIEVLQGEMEHRKHLMWLMENQR